MPEPVNSVEIYHTDHVDGRRLWSYRILWVHGGTFTGVGYDDPAQCAYALYIHLGGKPL
jgi:hypothetical protein